MAGREVSAIAFRYIHSSDGGYGISSPLQLLEHVKVTEIVLQCATEAFSSFKLVARLKLPLEQFHIHSRNLDVIAQSGWFDLKFNLWFRTYRVSACPITTAELLGTRSR